MSSYLSWWSFLHLVLHDRPTCFAWDARNFAAATDDRNFAAATDAAGRDVDILSDTSVMDYCGDADSSALSSPAPSIAGATSNSVNHAINLDRLIESPLFAEASNIESITNHGSPRYGLINPSLIDHALQPDDEAADVSERLDWPVPPLLDFAPFKGWIEQVIIEASKRSERTRQDRLGCLFAEVWEQMYREGRVSRDPQA